MSINKSLWKTQGFLLQINFNQYVLGAGPFIISTKPDINKGSLFFPPFFYNNKEGLKPYFYRPSTMAVFSRKELLFLLESQNTKINIADISWQQPCFKDFKLFFLKAQNQIKLNKLKKVVPVFFETADYAINIKEILSLIYRLIYNSKQGTVYAYWSKKQAIIGNTPEYLFRKQNNSVHTMALAGTAGHAQHNLLTDNKEQEEHTIVVEELKKKLKPLGEYFLSDRYLYSIGDIKHLRTDFTLQLKKDISFESLCYDLHPTPALGGYPRKQALNLLRELNQQGPERHSYGAPFGIIMKQQIFYAVAIRNIQFINQKAYLGSGCGLVKNSQLKKEWQELKQKRQIIKDILF